MIEETERGLSKTEEKRNPQLKSKPAVGFMIGKVSLEKFKDSKRKLLIKKSKRYILCYVCTDKNLTIYIIS